MSDKEARKSLDWWNKHLESCRGNISVTKINEARLYVSSLESFGLESGQVRPGKLGQWDVLFSLCSYRNPPEEYLTLCGITRAEVEQLHYEDAHWKCVDDMSW